LLQKSSVKFLYTFYNIITAPGVMLHELGHTLFCVTAGVKIHKIKLFQFGKTAGYVVHDEPQKFFAGFLISFGPLIVNSLVVLFLFSQWGEPYGWHEWLFLWLGVAFGLHAIPSTEDAHSLFQLANRRVFKNPLVVVGYPFVLVLYVLNVLKRLHIDWLYVVLLFWLGAMYLKF